MGTLVGLRVPPPADENEFEDITLVAAGLRWPGGMFERNGTRGQRQDGIDVVGHDDTSRLVGIQCRNLEKKPSLKLVQAAIADAEKFKDLEAFYYACSSKRDAKLQSEVRAISIARKKAGKFAVGMLFWSDLWNDLALDPRQVAKFFPQFVAFDSLPDGIKPGVREKLQTLIWRARYRAQQDLGSLAAKLLDGIPSHIDEWGDACEFIAMDFGSVKKSLRQILVQYGDHLTKAVHDSIEKAIGIASDGENQVSFYEGVPAVSMKGRELASALYDQLNDAKQQSLTQLNKAAGMKE